MRVMTSATRRVEMALKSGIGPGMKSFASASCASRRVRNGISACAISRYSSISTSARAISAPDRVPAAITPRTRASCSYALRRIAGGHGRGPKTVAAMGCGWWKMRRMPSVAPCLQPTGSLGPRCSAFTRTRTMTTIEGGAVTNGDSGGGTAGAVSIPRHQEERRRAAKWTSCFPDKEQSSPTSPPRWASINCAA